jgi:hypothetical protein
MARFLLDENPLSLLIDLNIGIRSFLIRGIRHEIGRENIMGIAPVRGNLTPAFSVTILGALAGIQAGEFLDDE